MLKGKQGHLKIIVHAKFGGQTVYYGEFENREWIKDLEKLCSEAMELLFSGCDEDH